MKKRKKLLSKVNVSDIVSNHIKTLVNANTSKPSLEDWIIFLFIPMATALVVGWFQLEISEGLANTLITILAIFVGLLMNVIVLLFDIVKRDEEKNNIKNVVLRETLSNISYTILVSLVTIIFTLASYIEEQIITQVASVIIMFLMTHVVMTLLMVIKRMHALFANEMNE